MTNIFERRIRKLEAKTPMGTQRILVFGLPGQADPDPDDIGPDDYVLRVTFVGSCNGRLAEETPYARD